MPLGSIDAFTVSMGTGDAWLEINFHSASLVNKCSTLLIHSHFTIKLRTVLVCIMLQLSLNCVEAPE